MENEWYKVDRYPQFSVTRGGEVRNDVTGNILKMHDVKKTVKLSFEGRDTRIQVKNLLAQTFIPNPNNYRNVLPVDGDDNNIKLDNLYWGNGNDKVTVVKLSPGDILNNFTIIEDLYERREVRMLIVKCNKCLKEFKRAFSIVNNNECACDRPTTKTKEERNKFLLEKGSKRLIHTLGKDASVLLCRKCRGLETVSTTTISNKTKNYCCEEKEVKEIYKQKLVSKLRNKFSSMKSRCLNPNNPDYINYGGRGIVICKEWLEDSNKFIQWGIDNGFNLHDNLSIDRINNDGNYTPENCQWIPVKLNVRKTRYTKLTFPDVEFILNSLKNGTYTKKELTSMYNLSRCHINSILRGEIWNIDEKTKRYL